MKSESLTETPWFRQRLPWQGMLFAAIFPVLAFGLFTLLGGRNNIEVLSQLRPMGIGEMAIGLLYLFCYTLVAFLSPVFAIATILIVIWNRLVAS